MKINFHDQLCRKALIQAVHQSDQACLMQMINYTVLEVRPISMQSHEQEIDWMVFICLILDNIDSVTEYTSCWGFPEARNALLGAQQTGLNQVLNSKSLGEIGLDLLGLVSNCQSDWSWQYLTRIQSQFLQCCSPGDAVAKIFREHGLQAMLEYLIMNA